MRTVFKKIVDLINTSVDSQTSISSVRVQSYLIVPMIILFVMTFIMIEIWSFVHGIRTGGNYAISNEIIIIFGMMLSHHLAILFSRSKSQSMKELKEGDGKAAEDKPADQPTQ